MAHEAARRSCRPARGTPGSRRGPRREAAAPACVGIFRPRNTVSVCDLCRQWPRSVEARDRVVDSVCVTVMKSRSVMTLRCTQRYTAAGRRQRPPCRCCPPRGPWSPAARSPFFAPPPTRPQSPVTAAHLSISCVDQDASESHLSVCASLCVSLYSLSTHMTAVRPHWRHLRRHPKLSDVASIAERRWSSGIRTAVAVLPLWAHVYLTAHYPLRPLPLPHPRCSSSAGLRLCPPYLRPSGLFLMNVFSHSLVTDLGRSSGRPRARSQKS